MYSQDTFFDLSAWGQVGLAAISLGMFLLAVFSAWAILTRYGLVVRIVGGFVLFWLFVWLSPQIYYMYYWMIFPNLPLQWVIWPPEGPTTALNMMLFQFRQNLSAHSQGILGWCMLAAPFVPEVWRKLRR